MHPARLFTVEDRDALLAHLAAHPFLTLVGAPTGRPLLAHAPVVVRRMGDASPSTSIYRAATRPPRTGQG